MGKSIAVIDSGLPEDECIVVSDQIGMEGYDCGGPEREQAVVMYDDNTVVVVQPNEDGSYWRKIVRNKMVRMREVRRIKAAREFANKLRRDSGIVAPNAADEVNVISSWGPYTTTSGTAKKTGVAGLTAPART